jgi:hypothetical protein
MADTTDRPTIPDVQQRFPPKPGRDPRGGAGKTNPLGIRGTDRLRGDTQTRNKGKTSAAKNRPDVCPCLAVALEKELVQWGLFCETIRVFLRAVKEEEVTRSCYSDAKAMAPMVEAVIEAGHRVAGFPTPRRARSLPSSYGS